MKKYLIVAFFSCLNVFALKAQISIDYSDMPVARDTLRFSTAATNDTSLINHNYKDSGPGHYWYFGGMKSTLQGIDTFKPRNATPYKLGVSGTYGIKKDNVMILFSEVYDFFENNTTAFSIVSKGLTANITTSIPLSGNYSDKDEIYQFPLTFGDHDSSTFRVVATALSVITYTSQGYRVNQVDGWGTVVTPFGSFNCLRVKTLFVSFDTMKQQMIPFPLGIKTQRLEYKWLAKGIHIPVLEVSGTLAANGTFTPDLVKYRDIPRKVVNPNAPKPNFTADNLTPTTIETVTFTNSTQPLFPIPTFVWDFTPNTVVFMGGTTETSRSPMVLFSAPGYYSVKLTATSTNGTKDTLKTNYIFVTKGVEKPPVAEFYADNTNPLLTDIVHFTNTTKVIDKASYLWSVSPKTFTFFNCDPTTENPDIIFTSPGKYTVSLEVFSLYGSDTMTKVDYINANYTQSINDVSPAIKVNLYPNPVVTNEVKLEFDNPSASDFTITLIDSRGQEKEVLLNKKLLSGFQSLNLRINDNNISNGLYFLRISSACSVTYIKTIISK